MSHYAGRCRCGRPIHYPKGSTYGARWTCWKCGTSHVIARQGQPLHDARSRPPPTSSGSSGGEGFLEMIWNGLKGLGILVLLLAFLRGC